MRSLVTLSVASMLATTLAACGTSSMPGPAAPLPPAAAADPDDEPPPPPPIPESAPSGEPVQPLEPLPTTAPPPPKPDPEAPADLTSPPADAEQTPSGLVSKVLKPGTGSEHPRPDDTVTVHFSGWMHNGVRFDSTADRGQPIDYKLDRMIRGWIEGIGLMVEGEKRRLWIPGRLAYGDEPRHFGQPYGPLVFDVELLSFRHPPAPPTVPSDLKSPPADAVRTKSGIVYKVLRPGTGKMHPGARSTVEVHYSGWTLDGKMFDSSVLRGDTASFPLNGVIRGWTEGVQLMVVGEKARFWIPAKLAYGDNPGTGQPSGTLVFDIELLGIK
jgi:FKBP-type peptidyl-prolyl cis-trans isomerase